MGLLDLTRTIALEFKPDDSKPESLPAACTFRRLRGSEALAINAELAPLDRAQQYDRVLAALCENVQSLTVADETVTGATVKDALELLGAAFVFDLWYAVRSESGAAGMIPKSKHSPAT
jgi:hypothetical protein